MRASAAMIRDTSRQPCCRPGAGQAGAHGCGRSSGVEHNLAKVGVEGSNPFARSRLFDDIAKLWHPIPHHWGPFGVRLSRSATPVWPAFTAARRLKFWTSAFALPVEFDPLDEIAALIAHVRQRGLQEALLRPDVDRSRESGGSLPAATVAR